ncbi:acetyl-CoA carboxylase biotin carboxyl carrier protein subunit [Acidocella sp. MX-AZ03]|uniref:acetyl-CoA carboxylase biotin carboxyl carrier protein subunit n=1 Tax=Acidocella sp. MX-AZ03 TaxID=2697363 RepID=UPI0022DD0E8A|nr:acetyl-CoA carboxylase biotin carboxyl carrier protein subunit [Acidocella sp. MX-AZ03]WBO61209.1 acetyl-CoA carboxylase biotin carboxyl carrier protein subunit [Acidocella sp. MX-AZ03]
MEREDWAAKGLNSFEEPETPPATEEAPLPPGARAIAAPVPGSIWKILAEPGAQVKRGDVVMILESMKMEVRVEASTAGRLTSLTARPGQIIRAGQRLGIITTES